MLDGTLIVQEISTALEVQCIHKATNLLQVNGSKQRVTLNQ